MSDNIYTKPELRERLKNKILAGSKGGKPGQWSARKAQLLAQEYKAAGGGYKGKKKKEQKDLDRWTKEEWTTSDGKPAEQSDGTMRRYLPKKAWKELSPAERAETNKKKVEGSKKGEQFISNTSEAKHARKKVSAKLSKSIEEPVLYVEKSRKLHGRIDFQGLPISIENREGSRRYWYDPAADEHGSTKMKYPYGYIRGTLGLDGDEVDVFVGPNSDSSKVFVVTQMTRPEFEKVDEQKVMLGFNSAKEAKEAYLQHFNDPKFFGSMKEMDIEEFRQKLSRTKGKLIKHLYLTPDSASIQAVPFPGEKQRRNGAGGDSVSKSTIELLKGLNSRMLSTLKNLKAPQETQALPVDSGETVVEVSVITGPKVAQAMHVSRPFEEPIAPTVRVMTPFQAAAPTSPDFMSSCSSCGYTHKSLNECPRCATVRSQNREASPIWRR